MAGIVVKAVGEVDFRDFQKAQRELDKMRRSADTLDNRIRRVGDSFGKVGRQLKQTGGTMSRYVSAPMAALGGLAVRSAMDFEVSMARIEGLVGVAASEIGELADAARTLGPSYGVSANEAGEALFFITSAGLRGATAIEALDSSLKAAAIGLGDTATVADLLTSAVNAYGEETLGASEATDVLVNAVRLGKLEPSELAGAMGQVLPVASAMGVQFHEVGAAFAAMSRTGTNAEVAATQLRQILATILKPSVEAERALAGIGLSAEDLRQQIRERGLLSVLQTLITRFDGNASATSEVFGNIRALSGVLDLMGSNVEATTEIFDGMSESIGVGDDAFRTVSKTASQQFKVALEEAKGALMEAATEALPVLTDLAESLQDLVQDWRDLSDEQQKTYLKIAGVAAVAGPAIIVLGQLATAVRGLAAAFTFLMAHPIVALAGLVAGLIVYSVTLAKTTEEQERFREAQIDNLRETNETVAAYDRLRRTTELNAGATRRYAEETRSAARSAFIARREAAKWTDAMAENEARRFGLIAEQDRANRAAEEEQRLLDALNDAMGDVSTSLSDVAEKTIALDDETRAFLQTLNETYVGGTEAAEALAEYAREVLAAGQMTEQTKTELEGLASALRSELSDALRDAESRLGAAQQAFDAYRDSIADGVREGNTLADAAQRQSAAIRRLTDAETAYAEAKAEGDPERLARASEDLEAARDAQGTFADFLAENVKTATAFADQIDALRTAGASLEVTQQIAQLGAQTGGRIIAELLAGGAEAIRQANALTAAVQAAAVDAGNAAAQQFYGAGVRAAAALVDGVRSELEQLDDLLEEIVRRITAAFSEPARTAPAPSTGGGTTGGGAPTPAPRPNYRRPLAPLPTLPPGLEWGSGGLPYIPQFADGGLVLGPTLGMVGEAGPELIVPLDRADEFGQTNISITVTSADPQAVVEAIRKYTRRNGPLGASVTL